MVDSMPTGQAPPSRISSCSSSRSENSSATCAAVVGLTRPKRLALGAATPITPCRPAAFSSACATGCDGQRTPTESWPPAATAATSGRRGRISVSGPGQKAAISATAKSGTLCASGATAARQSPASAGGMCTISGWSLGLPLAEKMRLTALALPASAARP